MAKVWFKLTDPESNWDKVSLEGVDDVADIKRAIKAEMSNMLESCDAAALIISATKKVDDARQARKLNEMADLKSVLEHFHIEGGTKIQETFAENIRLFVSVPTGK